MRRLFITLGVLVFAAPAAFAHPAWDWPQPWSNAAQAPRLGVLASELSYRELDTLELPYGVRVTRVLPGSPAAAGGLHSGDILIELDGQPIFSVARLQWLVDKSAPDEVRVLEYRRASESATAEITLAVPESRPLRPPGVHRQWSWTSSTYLGVSLQSLTVGLREAFAVPGDAGLLVAEVFPGSPASHSGLRPGDVIVTMNRRCIRGIDDVHRVLEYSEPGEPMDVEIIRDKQHQQLSLTPGDERVPRSPRRWHDWREPHSGDIPFFVDPGWWHEMEDFIQRWRYHWQEQQVPDSRRAL